MTTPGGSGGAGAGAPDPDRVQFVQGGRPRFFDDPVNDQLLAMVMALLGEVCVLRERLDTLERVAAARGLLRAADLEDFVAGEDAARERDALRSGIMARVLSVLEEEVIRLRHEGRSGGGSRHGQAGEADGG